MEEFCVSNCCSMDKRIPPMTPASQVLEVLASTKPAIKRSKSKKVINKKPKFNDAVSESMRTIANFKIWQKEYEEKKKKYMVDVKKAEAILLKFFTSEESPGEVEVTAASVGIDPEAAARYNVTAMKFGQRVSAKKPRWSENIFIDAYNDFKKEHPDMCEAASIFYSYVQQRRTMDAGKPKVELSACLRK